MSNKLSRSWLPWPITGHQWPSEHISQIKSNIYAENKIVLFCSTENKATYSTSMGLNEKLLILHTQWWATTLPIFRTPGGQSSDITTTVLKKSLSFWILSRAFLAHIKSTESFISFSGLWNTWLFTKQESVNLRQTIIEGALPGMLCDIMKEI